MNMLIIGHRGAAGLEPENTIRSFKKAENLGVHMLELDARQSRDGEVIIIHDSDLWRLFGSDDKVAGLNLAELKQISSQRETPTLIEVISEIKTPINIHVKVHGIEQKILNAVKNFSSEVLISASNPKVLKKIRALDEKVKLGLVIGPGELRFLPFVNWLTKNLNIYSIHPKLSLVNWGSMQLLKVFKKKIFVWTVNGRSEFQEMLRLGVDGIFTDSPELFIKHD